MELLDIYNENGETTGKTIIRGDKSIKIGENEHIALSIIYIENSNGEFLIQKTSLEKGGNYSSTGGHIIHGDTPLDTIKREVKEELGISIDNDNIDYVGTIVIGIPLFFVFYLKKDINLNDIKVQKEEVDYATYMTKEQIENIIKEEKIIKSHGIVFNKIIEYKN